MTRTLLRGLLATCIAMAAGCSSTPVATTPADRAPSRPMPELAGLPDPVPRSEPRSRYGNPSTYVVFGKTYRVMDSATGYSASGIASWYGAKFHGRPTSSGERYDMYQLTAAHTSLPIPVYARVTNLDNNKSTIVRINDRGPFHDDRLIDLSYAAAVKLGFADRGTARVRVDVLSGEAGPSPRVASPASGVVLPSPLVASAVPIAAGVPITSGVQVAPVVVQSGGANIFLQAGAFKSSSGAESLRGQIARVVGNIVNVHHNTADTLYRVRIGPVSQMDEALRLQALVVDANLGLPLIVRE